MPKDELPYNEEPKPGNNPGRRKIPNLLIEVLKILIIGIIIVILVVVITIITVHVMSSKNLKSTFPKTQESLFASKPPILQWYRLVGVRGNTADNPPQVYNVTVSLGYDPQNKKLSAELPARHDMIFDIIRSYLSSKKADYLKNESRVKLELKNSINNILESGQVEDIAFLSYNVYSEY